MIKPVNIYEDSLSGNRLVFTDNGDSKKEDWRYALSVYDQNDNEINGLWLQPNLSEHHKELINNITNNESMDDDEIADLISGFIKNGGWSGLEMATNLPSAVTHNQKTAQNNKMELQVLKQKTASKDEYSINIQPFVKKLLDIVHQYLTVLNYDKANSQTNQPK